MNVRLFVLGMDIFIASVLLVVYGLTTGSTGLVGVGVSISVVGSVIAIYSAAPGEPTLGAILSYTSMLAHAATAMVEDLDLLSNKVCVHSASTSTLIVYSKTTCPDAPNPGVGFAGGSPYFSIPVSVLQGVAKLEELSSQHLEDSLNSLLVSELGFCKAIRVEQRGELLVVDVIGLAKPLVNYTKYPVDPVVLLPLAVIARLVGEGKIHLVEKETTPEYTRLIVRVEGVA
ncbi:MAG: hypothetical protein QW164_04900 [Desulfurococcaceae archaeon]